MTTATPVVLGDAVLSNGSIAVLGGNYVQLVHNGYSSYYGFDQLQVAVLSSSTPATLNQSSGLSFPAGESPNNGGWNPTYGGGAIAAIPTGGMVVVTWGGTNLNYDMQILNNSGAVTTTPFVIASQYTTTGSNDFYASNPNAQVGAWYNGTTGGIVVAWQNDDDQIMYMQRYTLAGVAVGSRVTVASNYSGSDQWSGTMAVDSSGDVVFGFGATDIYHQGSYKEFNGSNSVVGSGSVLSNEYGPKFAALPGGGFITVGYTPTGSYDAMAGTYTNFTMNIQEISASGSVTTIHTVPNAVAPNSHQTAAINWIVVLPDGTVEFQEDTHYATSTTADVYNISTDTLSRNTVSIGTLPFATSPTTGTEENAVGVGVNGSNQLVAEGLATDQAPVVTSSGGTTAATEQIAAVVDSAITVSDSDNTTLASATVSITGNLHTAEDVLAFFNSSAATYGNISASYNTGAGVLTLTSAGATATLAQWQAALRAVTYDDISDAPNTSNRTITFTANDGTESSNNATKTVSVTAVNDAPVLGGAGNSVDFTENGALTVLDSGLTISDPDSADLSGATVTISSGFISGDFLLVANQNGISCLYNAATGTLTLTGSSSVANYQAALRGLMFYSSSDNPDDYGNDTSRTITWQVNDGSGSNNLSNQPTTTVNITTVNDAPVLGGAGNSVGYTESGAGVALDSALTAADSDSAYLIGATVTISSGLLGGDTLNFANQNGITGSYDAGSGVLTLTGLATVANYQAALESVTFSSSSDNPDNFGADTSRTITWQVNDGSVSNNLSNLPATTVDIAAVNDAPVLDGAGNSVGFTENGTAVTLDSALTVADVDSSTLSGASVTISSGFLAGDTLNFTNQNGITGSFDTGTGILTLSGVASIANYQAALESVTFSSSSDNPDNFGADTSRTIVWQANDGAGSNNLSNQPVTTVAITALDDPGVAEPDAFVTAENAVLSSGNVLADNGSGADTDVDNSPIAVTAVAGGAVGSQFALPSGALLTLNADGTFSYDPNHVFDYLPSPGSGASNLTATDTFTCTIDGGGASSETATVTVTISGVDSDDLLIGTSGADTLYPGTGNDTVNALAGDDTIVMGANLNAGDAIDGGDGTDTVMLNGNYAATPLVLAPTTLVNVEKLSLGAGYSYDITTSDATVAAGQTLTVSAWSLGAGDALTFDGSAETDGTFAINGGDGNDTLTGGAGNDIVHPRQGSDTINALGGDDTIVMGADLDPADAIDGGDGTDTVTLSGDYAANPLVLSPTTLVNVEKLSLDAGYSYDITTCDATVAAGQTLAVSGWSLGAGDALTFDGSAEIDGRFAINGGMGNDRLTGGAGDDSFHPRQGNDTVYGMGGDDTIVMGADFTAADAIDGGDGTDTVTLSGDYATTPLVLLSATVIDTGKGLLVLHPATMVNVEKLSLGAGYSYNITTCDATVAAGATLKVSAGGLDASNSLVFDGSAETDGKFSFIGGAGDDTLIGGSGADKFDLTKGGSDVADGGGGKDTFYVGAARTGSFFIDGGAGTDTVNLAGDYSAGLTFGPSTKVSAEKLVVASGNLPTRKADFEMVNVEKLDLASGYSYKLVTDDATVASSAALSVDGSALGSSDWLVFDGSAETDGRFAISGGGGNDTLTGGAGADSIAGGEGNNVIRGNGGADKLSAGSGADTFVYGPASDSSGNTFDTITGFDAAADKIDLWTKVYGVDPAVNSGKLWSSSFDTNLASILNGKLKAHHAVLVTPSAGTYAGQEFLVIDTNGVAGYQAGADLVIKLASPSNLSILNSGTFG